MSVGIQDTIKPGTRFYDAINVTTGAMMIVYIYTYLRTERSSVLVTCYGNEVNTIKLRIIILISALTRGLRGRMELTGYYRLHNSAQRDNCIKLR